MPSPEVPEAPFRHLGERERYDGGFFSVVTATFVGPDGFTFEREVVRHPGAVCVVALEADRRNVLMIRQYRGPVDSPLLELPAGKRDVAEEDPVDCAARELEEEIGRAASSMTEVARFYNSPGISDEETICYLAEGLREIARKAHGIEEEHLVVERVAFSDLEELVAAGELVDAKSIIGLFAARSACGWVAAPKGEPAPDATAELAGGEAPPPAGPSVVSLPPAPSPASGSVRRSGP